MKAVWTSLFLVGTLAGVVAVWLGTAGLALLALVTVGFVVAGAGKPWASGGALGVGVGMGAVVLWSTVSCPGVSRFGGQRATCEPPDLGAYAVIAVGLMFVGALVTLRWIRNGR